MIGWLKGTPLILDSSIIIRVGDIGYQLSVGTATQQKCQLSDSVEMFVSQIVRENEISYFGFLTPDQKLLFEKLLGISGVGPKTALHLADYGRAAVTQAVASADVAFFTAIPRVGKKLAQKIIIELKGKLAKGVDLNLQDESPELADVRQALVSLGYSEQDIQTALQKIEFTNQTVEQLIKQALKSLH